jgi:hypothetical protein
MATRTIGRTGAFAEWARCLGLLGIGSTAFWLFIWLCFTSVSSWELYALAMVCSLGMVAYLYPTVVSGKLSYLEALPTRVPSRTFLEVPLLAISGLAIGIATRWHHYAPASAVTLWGCCAWTVATSRFLKGGRWLDVPVWFLTVGAAPFVSLVAYGAGSSNPSWTRAAIAALVMAALGLALSPRSLRPQLARPTKQLGPDAASPLEGATAPSFRPANTNVGFVQLFGFGWFMAMWFVWLLPIFNLAFVLVMLGARIDVSASASWLVLTTCMTSAVSAATSRRNIDFLGSRPLRMRRILASTVLPWFLCALISPVAALLQELSSQRSHESSARMALTALSVLFLGGVEARGSDIFTRRAGAVATGLGPIALLFVTMFSMPPLRLFPVPPFWSIAALAVVSAAWWYRRLAWRRLPITS